MGSKLQVVPAAAGLRWVGQAFAEFRRYPLGYASLFAGYMFCLLLALLLPLVGGVLLLMAPPLLTLVFMLAVHASVQGSRPMLDTFIAPWRKRTPDTRRRLVALLLFYAALVAAAAWVAEVQSGGAFDELFAAYRKGAEAEEEMNRLLDAPGVAGGVAWAVALISGVSMLFWFAPALVHWGNQSPLQAMFSSVVAIWRARWAFLSYGFFWIASMFVLMQLTNVLAAIAGPTLSTLLALPVHLALTCAFYVSLYFSFRDCFGEP